MRSQFVITATLVLDVVLFVLNLSVALAGGSRAVLSQAVFSISDLLAGAMILWGFLASQRPPDHEHPFGYGKERFFWSFSASLLTFAFAGVFVLVIGTEQVIDPHSVGNAREGLLVVGATLLFSVVGIIVLLRELRASRETIGSFLEGPHQGLKTIFYQDLVSVAGSAVAFAGIAVVYRTASAVIDGLTAVVVGILMVATGIVLAAESRDLLVGKAISPQQARAVLSLVERDPRVRKVRGLQSMMLGPEDVLLALKVNFQDDMDTDQIELAIDQLSIALREAFPQVRHLLVEPES
jgi:cation diffusion facilitator family transporter